MNLRADWHGKRRLHGSWRGNIHYYVSELNNINLKIERILSKRKEKNKKKKQAGGKGVCPIVVAMHATTLLSVLFSTLVAGVMISFSIEHSSQ